MESADSRLLEKCHLKLSVNEGHDYILSRNALPICTPHRRQAMVNVRKGFISVAEEMWCTRGLQKE